MKQKPVYLAPDNKCYPTMVDGAIPKIQLDADAGKVLVHPLHEIEYLRKIVDSADGWYEVDYFEPMENPTDTAVPDRHAHADRLGRSCLREQASENVVGRAYGGR